MTKKGSFRNLAG